MHKMKIPQILTLIPLFIIKHIKLTLPKQVPVNIILPTYPLNHNTPISSKGIFEQ